MRIALPLVRKTVLAASLAALLSCGPKATPSRTAPPSRAADAPASAAAYFADPLLSHVSLSPDGKRVAGVYARDGVAVLIVRPTFGGEIERLAKLDEPGMALRTVGWANDDTILVGIETPDHAGVRASRIMRVKLGDPRAVFLGVNPAAPVAAPLPEAVGWMPVDDEHVLVNYWQPGARGVSAELVNVERPAQRRIVVPAERGVQRWYADREANVRAGEGMRGESEWVVFGREAPDQPFGELVEFHPIEQDGFTFAGFAPSPRVLYVHAPAANGRLAVHEYELTERTLGPPRVGDPRYDAGALVQSRATGKLVGVEVVRERPELHFVDEAAAREQAALDRAFPGTTNRIVSLDRAERVAIVAVSGDIRPPEYYVYDREKKQMDFLFAAYPDLAKRPLAAMKPVRYAARDGLEIEAYLTLPPTGPAAKLPAIVIPHDGPSARDAWGWDPTVQFLASRGFAVFQPNYRGSSGYGRDHLRKGYRQWGRAMQDDLVDGVKWLVGQGVADPDRVGIYGVGYGGYAALMGLVNSPEGFRAGASRAGFSDLVEWYGDRDDYLYSDFNVPAAERLAEISPAHQARRIRVPVLIAHGEQDPVVRVEQARAMADALAGAGAQPELHLYRDEVHEFVDERNRIDFHEKLAAFFARHLAAAR